MAAALGAVSGLTDMFLSLFTTQLKNQNPMEPMDNYQFTSQLAQFTEIEQITNLTSKFEQFLKVQELGNANAMVGSRVRYTVPDTGEEKEGLVTGVRLDAGQMKLVVGDDLVSLSSVLEVTKADATAQATAQNTASAKINETGVNLTSPQGAALNLSL
jgi:flagellar basal-body rod modification protein FlgD